jgi:hypothetical protein
LPSTTTRTQPGMTVGSIVVPTVQVDVGVNVRLPPWIGVFENVQVGVMLGVRVMVGVGVAVRIGVCVGVDVTVLVTVRMGVGVMVRLAPWIGVLENVQVGVKLGVRVIVGVGVRVVVHIKLAATTFEFTVTLLAAKRAILLTPLPHAEEPTDAQNVTALA